MFVTFLDFLISGFLEENKMWGMLIETYLAQDVFNQDLRVEGFIEWYKCVVRNAARLVHCCIQYLILTVRWLAPVVGKR